MKAWASVQEKAALEVRAREQGISVARLLVESALGGGMAGAVDRRVMIAELTQLRTLLGRTSTNINQIARHANAERTVPEDAGAAVRAARELMGRIDAVVRELSES